MVHSLFASCLSSPFMIKFFQQAWILLDITQSFVFIGCLDVILVCKYFVLWFWLSTILGMLVLLIVNSNLIEWPERLLAYFFLIMIISLLNPCFYLYLFLLRLIFVARILIEGVFVCLIIYVWLNYIVRFWFMGVFV